VGVKMGGRSGKGSWVRRILVLLNFGAVTAVVLWTRRSAPWWLGMLLAGWGGASAAFFRWFDWRGHRAATSDASARQRPPAIEIPVALQTPPPRAVRSEFAARAVRHYRTAYPALLAFPILLGVCWFPRTDAILKFEGLVTVQALVLLALVMAVVHYVESNVRAVRRLVRLGSVSQGAVANVSPLRNKVMVRFSFAGAPLQVSVPLDEVGDLEPELHVPVLVASGSSLVGLITASGKIVVARM
jgi:hypothetical protein